MPALVSDPSQVTADWLTAVLAHAGELSGGAVAGFEVAAIGTGSVGSTLRYRLRYRAGSAAGPSVAVVVKFAAAEEASRAANIATHSYARTRSASTGTWPRRWGIRRPRCYHAA